MVCYSLGFIYSGEIAPTQFFDWSEHLVKSFHIEYLPQSRGKMSGVKAIETNIFMILRVQVNSDNLWCDNFLKYKQWYAV